jgi:regulatory protein
MKITAITAQIRDKDRVNVMVDGKFRFSLDILQLGDLGIRVGREYTEAEMLALEEESQFGKIYTRALEYALARPRSAKEIRDYLYRKTRDTRTKTGQIKKGASSELTKRVFDRLASKGYIDDEKFARFWTQNRNQIKGISQRKLQAELRAKGIEPGIINRLLSENERSDSDELQKVIAKKRNRYTDDQKFMAYLVRQGFSYDDVKAALAELGDVEVSDDTDEL